MEMYTERFLACLFHLSSNEWAKPDSTPNHVYIQWIGQKRREWLTMIGRPADDRMDWEDAWQFDKWLRSLPRQVVFIDEKDAADVPELKVGQTYKAKQYDGELMDVYTLDSKKIGTYCVERFRPA